MLGVRGHEVLGANARVVRRRRAKMHLVLQDPGVSVDVRTSADERVVVTAGVP